MKLSTVGILAGIAALWYIFYSPYAVSITPVGTPTSIPTATAIPEEPIFDIDDPTRVPRPTPTMDIPVIRRAPAVVTAIRSLGRLETVSYTYVQPVIVTRERLRLFGFYKESELVRIDGKATVTAGVDLDKIFSSAVEVDEEANSVVITLPLGQIHTIEADEASLRPSHHEASAFGTAVTDSLVSFTRLEVLKRIEARALESDICRVAIKGGKDLDGGAVKGAEQQIRSMLKALKFKKITIVTKDGSCTRAP